MAIAVVFAIIAFYFLDSEFPPHVWKGETLSGPRAPDDRTARADAETKPQ